MNRRNFFIIFFILLSGHLFAQTVEDCKIYSKAFNKIVHGETYVLLENEDTSLSNIDISRKIDFRNYTKSDSTVKQFNFKDFPCDGSKLKIIANKRFNEFFKSLKNSWDKGWEQFYKNFPDSREVISVSRFFFTKDHQKAIFYLSYTQGDLNAAGFYITMSKNKGEWVIETTEQIWVS